MTDRPAEIDAIVSTLRSERRRRGLSQTDVARLIGRQTYQTIHQWERVNAPTLSNLRTWAAALGFDLTLAPLAEIAQCEYDSTHDPTDHHCLADPCVWHPFEQRILPSPTFPARLVTPSKSGADA